MKTLEELDREFFLSQEMLLQHSHLSLPATPAVTANLVSEIPSVSETDQCFLELETALENISLVDAEKPQIVFNKPNKPIRGLIICTAILIILALVFGEGGFMKYSWFRVMSDSMEREIPRNSLVITKKINPVLIQMGDTITFINKGGINVTHKVVRVICDNSGIVFETKGTENTISDPQPVPAKDIIGVVVYHTPRMGRLIVALRPVFIAGAVILIIIIVWLFLKMKDKIPD